MSKYTTGEVAKLCGVTVRTVQYYDKRGILVPGELTEGGRRLYSEADVSRMKIICFLRELGLPIEAIRELLSEEEPGKVISLLLDQQEQTLSEEIREREEQLRKVEELRDGLRTVKDFSFESIGDIAYTMANRKKLKKIHITLLLTAIPLGVFQWGSIILWITKGIWQPFLVWVLIAIPCSILLSRWYFRNVAYICPQCHAIFRPSFKEAFFAPHTPATRRLTCPSCGHRGYCVEVAREEETA